MTTFAVLTRLSPDALTGRATIEELAERVTREVEQQCPQARWLANYAVLGSYDYLDIFEAANEVEAAKVITIIRSFGHATTETWTLIAWDQYKRTLEGAHDASQ